LVWEAKKLDYLKLPVFHPDPKSAQRAFSSERRRKICIAPDFIDSDDDQIEQSSQMNKSAYAGLPSK